MLVTFSCQAYANVTFFGDVGQSLIKLMGYSPTASGAIPADSIPMALERLKKTAAVSGTEMKTNRDSDFGDEAVSLSKRALPLIELLRAAEQEKCNVWWEIK